MDPQIAPMGMLPLELAIALLENPAAWARFSNLSPTRQNRLIASARRARSPGELQRLLTEQLYAP